MIILGISAYFHDSAAAIIKNGKLIAAAEEERFNREKHTRALPILSTKYCLEAAGIPIEQIDYLAFYQIPLLTLQKRLMFFCKTFPYQLQTIALNPRFAHEGLLLSKAFRVKNDLFQALGTNKKTNCRQINVEHHLAHAASCFYPSKFRHAAILSIDGAGEITTTLLAHATQHGIKKIQEIAYPDSLGLVYSAGTEYLGFRKNSDEGKVMGLAPYGKYTYKKEFDEMVQLYSDGTFKINRAWFDYWKGSYRFYSKKWVAAFGEPRKKEQMLNQKYKDIAASLQEKTEEIGVAIAKKLQQQTGEDAICIAGGVGLNALMNARILNESGFTKIFVQPAANDAGAALGAALFAHQSIIHKRISFPSNIYLGPHFSNSHVLAVLKNHTDRLTFNRTDTIAKKSAYAISRGKILAWFQGRMEFGPRALGARSIVVDPRRKEMKDILNIKVKHRESFRPFAPSILEAHLSSWYETKHLSPFMNLIYFVKKSKQALIPAPTHVDGSGRVQTVNRKDNGRWYELIYEFYKITKVPLVLNTSFNIGSEPIICTPEQAVSSFLNSKIDVLAIEDYFVTKKKK